MWMCLKGSLTFSTSNLTTQVSFCSSSVSIVCSFFVVLRCLESCLLFFWVISAWMCLFCPSVNEKDLFWCVNKSKKQQVFQVHAVTHIVWWMMGLCCSAEGSGADSSSCHDTGLRERAGWAVWGLPGRQRQMENRCKIIISLFPTKQPHHRGQNKLNPIKMSLEVRKILHIRLKVPFETISTISSCLCLHVKCNRTSIKKV